MKKYDVIFIGSGHATWHGATKLAKDGKKVALVESDTLFGTCTNYGCNAKMFLDGPADLIHQVNAYRNIGLNGKLSIDWKTLMQYKHKTLDDPKHENIRESLAKIGIDIIDGFGKLKDAHHVQVNNDIYETKYIVIGTGLRPFKLNISGKEYLHDSRDFLSIPEMPKHITFIGTGIIAYEFADLANAAGADVEVIGHSDHPLRNFYPKYVKKLTKQMKKNGIHFDWNQNVDQVKKEDNHFLVHTKEGLEVKTNYVLDATGRIANVENMGLENLGIQTNHHGIKVDDYLRTNVKNIFASGDVIDKKEPKLTPTATYESNYIAKLMLGYTVESLRYPPIAEALFSLPRLSQVGIKPQNVENNNDYNIKRIPYGMITFETKNEPKAEATVVLDHNNEIVGAAILGNQAVQLANILAIMISKHMKPNDIDDDMIMAFPDESFGLFQLLNGGLPS